MDLKLAVFDLDGTLVDSRAVIGWAMDTAFAELGLEPPGYERTRTIVGLSLDVACRQLAGPDIDPPGLMRLVNAYKRAFWANRLSGDIDEPLYPGAEQALRALAEQGWLMSIATGKARRGVQAFYEHHPQLRDYFISDHCADDGPGKPHPAMLLAALESAGADRARAVMIGDSVHDMAMAEAARVKGLGVSWGFHTADELGDTAAHHVAHDFDELRAVLASLHDPQAV